MSNLLKITKEELPILLLIGMCVLILFLGLIYMTFFMVKIKGAMEERDCEYDLLKFGTIKYKNNCWEVDIKDFFNEYAAIKIDFGWTFRMLFENWELNGYANGEKCGVVHGVVSRETILLRRKIRRN